MKILQVFFIILFCITSIVYSQNELSRKKKLLLQKQNQLLEIEQKISTLREENNKDQDYLIVIDKKQKDKQFDYYNKKSAFERASKNVDLVSAEKLNQLSNEYKLSDKELREINTELQKAKLKEKETSQKLEQATSDKNQIEQDIQNLKADIFDIQLREPVWCIGEAICNLAENETPDQCRKRALEASQRDAMEKGGKMILESETIVKNYKLYLDEIRTHIKAQILEQDKSPQYGVKRELFGDNLRYIAKLRIKVQSISLYNPYRKRKISVQNGKFKEADKDFIKKETDELTEEMKAITRIYGNRRPAKGVGRFAVLAQARIDWMRHFHSKPPNTTWPPGYKAYSLWRAGDTGGKGWEGWKKVNNKWIWEGLK